MNQPCDHNAAPPTTGPEAQLCCIAALCRPYILNELKAHAVSLLNAEYFAVNVSPFLWQRVPPAVTVATANRCYRPCREAPQPLCHLCLLCGHCWCAPTQCIQLWVPPVVALLVVGHLQIMRDHHQDMYTEMQEVGCEKRFTHASRGLLPNKVSIHPDML